MIETEDETRSSYSITVENIQANNSTEAISNVKKALKLDNISDVQVVKSARHSQDESFSFTL